MTAIVLACILGLLPSILHANESDTLSIRKTNLVHIAESFQERLVEYEQNPDFMVLPGLLADRKSKRIFIQAEATGISAGTTVEFFLIGENSGHAYETLAISFAKPGEIRKALIFTGIQPGVPAQPKALRFTPKGERVLMTFSSTNSIHPLNVIRAEDMIFDNVTGKSLPRTGFVFTGSFLSDPDAAFCSADTRQPCAIAANYNEPSALLDLPRPASQGDIYGKLTVHSNLILHEGQLLEILLEPEYKDGKKRVIDLVLTVEQPSSGKNIQCTLTGTGPENLVAHGALNDVLEQFSSFTDNGHTPYVSLRFEDNLSLGEIQKLCAVLAAIETESGIQIEPPPAGHLYYRAFLPNEERRARTNRIVQPWELLLKQKKSVNTGTLVEIQQIWKDNQLEPELIIKKHKVSTPAALRKKLDEIGPGVPAVFVFADVSLSYGALMSFLTPIMTTHPMVHVFLEK